MSAQIRDERFREMIGDTVELERLAGGFTFTEGPIWHTQEHHLTFSDMPADHMRRWSPSTGVTTLRQPSNMANGNAYDAQGRMLTCEHATSRVTRTEADQSITVLASHYDGQELNSPNDIVVRRDGLVFFTDPTYGRMEFFGVPREPELSFRGVYCVKPDGSGLSLLADDFAQPNGLCLSLDQQRLYVNDTERSHVRVFDVNAQGDASGGDVWVTLDGEAEGHPDGMKIDSLGNLYCTGPGGVHVFTPDGVCLGVILMAELTANFTWGGEDLRQLFFTSSTSLYRCETRTAGLPAF
ncbi:SMP-30/gluconolactonase/LRE family protein [Granulosicoccus sp. 3-233]|uniref:SMP-30/gluconolactonase/LRE family protein n=1 Tax=Granulosicoccus sp. 3-233 TaxID=3417969 RepID=UPI003D32C309